MRHQSSIRRLSLGSVLKDQPAAALHSTQTNRPDRQLGMTERIHGHVVAPADLAEYVLVVDEDAVQRQAFTCDTVFADVAHALHAWGIPGHDKPRHSGAIAVPN